MTPDATHQPLLFEMIKRTDKPILELGAGESSTRQIHELAKDRLIVTLDDSIEWLKQYKDLASNHHYFWLVNKEVVEGVLWYEYDETNYGVVLVDLSTWELRNKAIKHYKKTSDYIIVHDSENPLFINEFKYSKEFIIVPGMPHVTLGSDFYTIDLKL